MKQVREPWDKVGLILGVLFIVFGVGFLVIKRPVQAPGPGKPATVETFEECAAAGYPVMETYPEQCRTPDGQTFTRVTPVVTPSPITLTGIYDCLPKKQTGRLVTMECAFGLHTDTGDYALDLSNIPTKDYPAIKNGDTITITGTLVPIEMISSDRWTTFDVTGIVAVDSIRTINQ